MRQSAALAKDAGSTGLLSLPVAMQDRFRRSSSVLLLLPWLAAPGCRLDTEGALATVGPSPDASVSDADAGVQDGSFEAQSEAGFDAPVDTVLADGSDGDVGQEAGDAAIDAPDADFDADACAPETNAAFCARHGIACGSYTGEDNCGETRSADCGGCGAPSTCGGGGTANVCDWWWACEWSHRRRLTVSSQQALPAGYSISFELDHGSLVNAGLSAASGDDVRLVHVQGGQVAEIDRVLDPESQWNSGATRLWFAAQTSIPAGGQDDYYLFVGNAAAGPAPADEAAVFHFADFFDRADADDPGFGWLSWETATGANVRIAEQALWFGSSDQNNRPVADHPFLPISEVLELRFGVDWQRTGAEGWYRLHLQLGDSGEMEIPPPEADAFSNAGTGPSLLWTGTNGGMTDHEGFGYEVAGTVTQSAVVSGKASIALRTSVPTRSFDLFVDGVQVADDAPFSTDQDSLDRFRFFAWQVNSALVGRTALDWVLLRPVAENEPTVSSAAFEQGACP